MKREKEFLVVATKDGQEGSCHCWTREQAEQEAKTLRNAGWQAKIKEV